MRRLILGLIAVVAVLGFTRCSSHSIGSACSRNQDCGSDSALCLTGAGVYPGGYCSRLCDHDSDCGDGTDCELSTGNGLCVERCKHDSDCRAAEGYHCYAPDEGSTREACLPVFDGGVADGG